MKILIISFYCSLVIPIFSLKSQDYIKYYQLRNEAVWEYCIGNLYVADSILEASLSYAEGFSKDLFLLSVINAKIENKAKTKKYLRLAAISSKGGIYSSMLEDQKSHFSKVMSIEELSSFKDSLDIINKFKEYQITNLPFYISSVRSADDFIKRDQILRSNAKSELTHSQIMLRDSIDLALHSEIASYLDIYGWPLYASEEMNTILNHFTTESIDLYNHILFNEVKKGRLDPYWYGSMLERWHVIENPNFCKYGIWNKLCPIELIEKNRKEIGMSIYWEGPYRIFYKYCDL